MVYVEKVNHQTLINNSMQHSSRNRKISVWWSKLKSPFPSKTGKSRKDGEEDDLCRKVNVNEEYKEVFRTQSYAEIWSKVQVQLKDSKETLDDPNKLSFSPSMAATNLYNSSPLHFYVPLSDCLLEPRQEAAVDMIKSSNLEKYLIDYFNLSLEACNLCELLLRGIYKTRFNHRVIKRVIALSRELEEDQQKGRFGNYTTVIQELASFARMSNPLSIINGSVDFHKIHDKYALLLGNLTSKRRKIKKREKFTRVFKKAANYGFMITYTLLTIALLTLAIHSVIGLIGVPGLLMTFSMCVMKKLYGEDGHSHRVSFLERLGSQLDVAAKGIYILINDFDTVGRLVMRVHDEVEHRRAIAKMCVRNRKSHDVIKEAIRELYMHEDEFVEQLEELEEHIYLCFLTINRSRRLVLQELLAP